MSKTKIQWATAVFNPVTGCSKISEGCKNCYAERMHTRLEHIKGSGYMDGKPHFSVRLHPERLEEPLKWKKPQRIFVCSMGDLFHEDVPFPFVAYIYRMMALANHHTYMILTKRPERMRQFIEWYIERSVVEGIVSFADAYQHVLLGVTVENQQAADERIPILLQIPAAKRFLSIEPMVGPVDLYRAWWGKSGDPAFPWLGKNVNEWLHCVILGGETGPKARPLHPDWARSVRDQCQAAGVPFFFKQWGEWSSWEMLNAAVATAQIKNGRATGRYELKAYGKIIAKDVLRDDIASSEGGMFRVGKKAAGHLLDGKEYREWPKGGV